MRAIKILRRLIITFIFLIAHVISVSAQGSDLFITPMPTLMGSAPIGSSVDRIISITNFSISSIDITNISIGGESAINFVITNNPNSYTLPAFEELFLNITYTPTSSGKDIALLQIQTSTETVIDSLIAYGSVIVNGVPTFERIFSLPEVQDWGTNLLAQTVDGGYVVVGQATIFGEARGDAFVRKTDKYGREEWTKLFGGSSSDDGKDVVALNDGSSVIGGDTQSFTIGDPAQVYLFKIDSQGALLWQKDFGGAYEDQCNSIIQASDGGFIIAGNTKTETFASTDAYVIKTDSDGNLQWSKSYGGQYGEDAFDIISTSDGGYIFVGNYQESLNPDIHLVKIDATGNELWSKTFSTPYPDEGRSICSTSDGGYIIGGYTTGENAKDGYLLKINADGEQQWSKSYGGPHSDYFSSVVQTPDGGYLCAGAINQFFSQEFIYDDLYVVKTDSDGNLIGEEQFGDVYDDYATGMIKTKEGGYIISGSTQLIFVSGEFTERKESYLLGVNVDGNITEVKINDNSTIPSLFSLSQNYPNPFNPSTTIQFDISPLEDQSSSYVLLKIYDVIGNELTTLVDKELTAGNYKVEFNSTNVTGYKLSSGIYFYRLISGNLSIIKKMVLLK